jgi:preprotein translocase subunit YajC
MTIRKNFFQFFLQVLYKRQTMISTRRRFAFFVLTLGLAFDQAMALGMRPNADPNASQPPAWAQWVPILVMVGVFYFLLIRPQMSQKKQRDLMLNAIKKGDKITTSGGLICTVMNVGTTILDVKLNEDTKAKLLRSAVTEILTDQSDQKPIEPQIVNP